MRVAKPRMFQKLDGKEVVTLNKVGTVLIGCGKVADAHAQALSSLQQSRFVGVYDRDVSRAKEYANKYSVIAFEGLRDMLDRPDVEMASVCTPHGSHPEMVEACAEAGVHPLIEKPMAVDLKGCDRAIRAAHRAGVKLGVISQRRFYPPVRRMKDAIESGKIGAPILGSVVVLGWRDEAYYRMDKWRGHWATEGGGVLLTQASHQLDLFQWFMGPIYEVSGYWANLNHPYVEVEDTATAIVRFKSGALGSVLVSNSQKPGLYAKIHVHGSNGASVGVQTDGGSPFVSGISEVVDPPVNDIWTVPGEEPLLAEWQGDDKATAHRIDVMTHYHMLQIQDFLESILDDREPAVSGEEGRKHVELFAGIYRSNRDRRPVRFPLDAERGSQEFDGRLSPMPGGKTLGV
jgi:UDP-N-acetyl-2-amino-2-deoxyglucuronate dehydrogenase